MNRTGGRAPEGASPVPAYGNQKTDIQAGKKKRTEAGDRMPLRAADKNVRTSSSLPSERRCSSRTFRYGYLVTT